MAKEVPPNEPALRTPQQPVVLRPTATSPSTGSGNAGSLEARSVIKWEIILVFALSLGRSAIYSVIELIGRLTDSVPLADQVMALNPSRSTRPYLDLALQLYSIIFALMPVALALFFLATRAAAKTQPEFTPRNALGLDWCGGSVVSSPSVEEREAAVFPPTACLETTTPSVGANETTGHVWKDLAKGFALFAAVGIPGLAFFAVGRALGITVQVQASALSDYWWTIPILILSAFQNGALEEIIVVGYLYRRTQDLGWSQSDKIDLRFLLASALIRGSYHLYQGIGPFIGNFVMGLFFAWWFQSKYGRKRVIPLIVAHTLLDTVAFVGYQFAPAALLNLIGLG